MRDLVFDVVTATLQALKAQGTLALEKLPAFKVDPPKNPAHGDYSANVAMMLAKPEGKPPRQIAQAIADALVDDAGVISKVDIAGPGFLNFTLSDAVVQKTVRTVLQAGERWGRQPPKSGKKVMVEFVPANPTGPLHLGHARGAFMGDAVARLLDAAGHDVTREFYVNDAGKQVETLGRSVYKRYQELHGQEVTLAEGEYPGEYVIAIAQSLKDADGDKWLSAPESAWLPRCVDHAIAENLRDIKEVLESAGITHDVWFSERTLHDDGKVAAVVEAYREKGATYEATEARGTDDKVRRDGSKAAVHADGQKGGTFLQTSRFGDEEDRIILRHDGSPVYLTADLAYHQDKYARGFDRMIDVWGADHRGHVGRIKAGMALLDLDASRFEFLLVQMVRLLRNGEPLVASKRKGNVYTLRDLISEVGADPVRFIFLMRAAGSQFDFDVGLALEQSNDNPVFYAQMGHARCVNVMKKAEETGQPFVGEAALSDVQLARLVLPEERDILKKISALPEVISGAADSCEPHRVLYYCQDLISDFHSYFTKYKHDHRIVSDDHDVTQARLGMVAALRSTLKCALGILGISAPDYMRPRDDAAAKESA